MLSRVKEQLMSVIEAMCIYYPMLRNTFCLVVSPSVYSFFYNKEHSLTYVRLDQMYILAYVKEQPMSNST